MKKKPNRIFPVFFICSVLLLLISCSYMKTDLGNEDIDVSITQIEISGKKYVILSFNTITSALEIPASVQDLPVLKIYFNKTTNLSALTSITFDESSSVTEIDTFKGASSLGSIVLPDSLTVMPTFQNCKALTKVTLSSKITEIPESCFEGCSSLESVSKPVTGNSGSGNLNGITAIGKSAFNGCTKLTSIALETTSITELMDQTFYKCSALTTVKLPGTVQAIGKEVFGSCGELKTVEGFENVAALGDKIFDSCSKLETIKLNSQITVIPDNMFSGCSALKAFDFPEQLTKIGKDAFYKCNTLTTVTLPETVKSVGAEAFGSCINLTKVEGFEKVVTLGEKIFESCSKLSEIKISEQIEKIPESMFSGCSSLKTFTIPEKVKEIGNSAFANTLLKELFCYAKEPPKITKPGLPEKTNTKPVETKKPEIYVYVPEESVAVYIEKWGEVLDLDNKIEISAIENYEGQNNSETEE